MDRGDGRTKYVLRGEGAGAVFVIDEKTGNIHVTKPLDREEKDEYRLIATATDRQTDRALEPSSTFIIRVQDINDNPPLFEEGPYSATVPEMANIGTAWGAIVFLKMLMCACFSKLGPRLSCSVNHGFNIYPGFNIYQVVFQNARWVVARLAHSGAVRVLSKSCYIKLVISSTVNATVVMELDNDSSHTDTTSAC
jgi:hypothetical protein